MLTRMWGWYPLQDTHTPAGHMGGLVWKFPSGQACLKVQFIAYKQTFALL